MLATEERGFEVLADAGRIVSRSRRLFMDNKQVVAQTCSEYIRNESCQRACVSIVRVAHLSDTGRTCCDTAPNLESLHNERRLGVDIQAQDSPV